MNFADLSVFDDGFSVHAPARRGGTAVTAPAAAAAGAPTAAVLDAGPVPNGFLTLTFQDGGHRTFRVWTKHLTAKFAPGQRLLGMLIGPDRTTDFEPFAFVEPDGFRVWKRFRGGRENPSKHEEYAQIVWWCLTGETPDGYELQASKRCLVCNRELTTPESLERGIGPLCWERMNG